MDRLFRLPDGNTTRDVELYARVWTELGNEAASFFPGYVLSAMNPRIHLDLRETLEDGTYRVLDTIVISVNAIKTLRDEITAREAVIREECQGGKKT